MNLVELHVKYIVTFVLFVVQCQFISCASDTNLFFGPYNFFTIGSSGQSGSSGTNANDGTTNCIRQGVKTIPFSLKDIYLRGPVYTWLLSDSPSVRQVDSICTTFFPLADGADTYLAYNSYIFVNGSTTIDSSICIDVGVGKILRSNAEYVVNQYFFAYIEGAADTVLTCEQEVYGQTSGQSVGGSSFGPPQIKQLRLIDQLIDNYNLAPQGLYVLPYRFPPKCVTQQVCSQLNPLLYDPYGYAFSRNTYPPYIYPS